MAATNELHIIYFQPFQNTNKLTDLTNCGQQMNNIFYFGQFKKSIF